MPPSLCWGAAHRSIDCQQRILEVYLTNACTLQWRAPYVIENCSRPRSKDPGPREARTPKATARTHPRRRSQSWLDVFPTGPPQTGVARIPRVCGASAPAPARTPAPYMGEPPGPVPPTPARRRAVGFPRLRPCWARGRFPAGGPLG